MGYVETEALLGDGATGPAVRDLGERAQVEVNIRNLASVRDYQLLPQTVPEDIITVDIGQLRYYNTYNTCRSSQVWGGRSSSGRPG